MAEAATALRDLRDALRAGLDSTDDFVFRLSSTLDVLGLAPTSVAVAPDATKATGRHLAGVQTALLSVLPTFLPALDARGRALLDTFFCPPSPSPPTASLCNAIALSSYITLSGALAPNPPTPLPAQSRDFVLTTLAQLSSKYGVDALYWAVWGAEGRARQLVWDDAVRAAVGVPAKVANAVGRWRETDASWRGDVPAPLVPRAYFDALVRRLENLAYELALAHTTDLAPLRVLIEKLAALGLFGTPPEPGPSPTFLPPFLRPALAHLHPPPGGLEGYPDEFFPKLFLAMPTSTVGSVADGLLAHLPYRLITEPPLEPDVPDGRVRRAAVVLGQLLGKAEAGGDAWAAVVQALMGGKLRSSGSETVHQARRRMVVAWAGAGGLTRKCAHTDIADMPAARALVDTIMDAWSDPKGIKFGLFAQQFSELVVHDLS